METIEEEVDQPCKESQSQQAAADEYRQQQVVSFVNHPENIVIDAQEQEQERAADAWKQHRRACQDAADGKPGVVQGLIGYLGAAAGTLELLWGLYCAAGQGDGKAEGEECAEELDHDFLWRSAVRLPERGRIGIFNRSYYEETLVVRVHPEYLKGQRIPETPDLPTLWKERYESIRDHEQHLARNGTVVLKFWLNVGKDEQKERFLSRIDEPDKNWKFSSSDVRERGFWDQYMSAYESVLNATSRDHAPWYAIPANSKSYMRVQVAKIIVQTLEAMPLAYPTLGDKEQARLDEMREMLVNE